MLARSPITKVDQIHTPLLVIQGANHVRVVQAESDNLIEALRTRGVEVARIVKDDEGHGFGNLNNVIDILTTVGGFRTCTSVMEGEHDRRTGTRTCTAVAQTHGRSVRAGVRHPAHAFAYVIVNAIAGLDTAVAISVGASVGRIVPTGWS